MERTDISLTVHIFWSCEYAHDSVAQLSFRETTSKHSFLACLVCVLHLTQTELFKPSFVVLAVFQQPVKSGRSVHSCRSTVSLLKSFADSVVVHHCV